MAAHFLLTPAGVIREPRNYGFADPIRRIFRGIGMFFSIVFQAAEATARYQHLNACGDRRLCKAGIKRQDIARAAFEQTFAKL